MTASPSDAAPAIALGHRRNDLLDAFRGIAVLLVLVFHYATETLGHSKGRCVRARRGAPHRPNRRSSAAPAILS